MAKLIKKISKSLFKRTPWWDKYDSKYFLYLWYRFRKHPYFKYVDLEFTSCCDLRCIYCTLDSSRKKGFMPLKLYEEILQYIVDNNRKRITIEGLSLHNGGETLLHPKFCRMMEILGKKRKITNNFPETALLTNATTLNSEKTACILNTECVDFMRFSVDGGTKESFERIRKGAKWEKILANIHSFLDENSKKKNPVKTGMISIFDEANPPLSDEFNDLIKRVDIYWPRRPHNFNGSKNMGLGPFEKKTGLCNLVPIMVAILYDGTVSPCCNDLNGSGIIGDLNTEDLAQIFFGKPRSSIIEKMAHHKRRDIELCKDCAL
ncbi:MAG: radical SAM protein [Omnitrophica bacterium]|nr:radical SAM protein [Candidatus Omnitrophota bacterium]